MPRKRSWSWSSLSDLAQASSEGLDRVWTSHLDSASSSAMTGTHVDQASPESDKGGRDD